MRICLLDSDGTGFLALQTFDKAEKKDWLDQVQKEEAIDFA
ncbi:hypothetical protein HMPREF1508_2050 [Shuttleworthella sp. MSX8B]|nr:hypothetical protein HMPREF1508_2050 [Shuttleworthia sp. MSX8B]